MIVASAVLLACLGDSNTHSGWAFAAAAGWCEQVSSAGYPTANYGVGGAALTSVPGLPAGMDQVALALQDRPEIVVLAFGTNDIRFGASPDALVVAVETALATVHAAGADGWVALLPPLYGEPLAGHDLREEQRGIRRANRQFRRRFRGRLLDFASGIRRQDYLPDGLHLNPAGQAKRARIVLRRLRRATRQ